MVREIQQSVFGKGDEILLGNLYLEYNDGKTLVRVGRQEMITDWLGKYNDGVRITNTSIENLTLDLFWTQKTISCIC